MRILIVEDDKQQGAILSQLLKSLGHETIYFSDPFEGLESFKQNQPDLVLLDMRMPGMDGMTFLKKAIEIYPEARIIMLTAYGTIETAVEAMKRGAFDFLVKPIEESKLKQVLEMVQNAAQLSLMASYSAPECPDDEQFLAIGPVMKKVKDLIRRVASLTTTVLIQGETGTGKELVARAIHSNSPRRDKPFIAVNCANLTGNLLESELFGYEKGAFTGADTRKLGKFELASGGTLFLDEVSEIPLELQPKLLRAIQEQEFERLGGTKTVRVDVRIVSATNRDLRKMVEKGTFRDDLYYRLNVFPLKLPPLRERKEDIPALATKIVQEFATTHGKKITGISAEGIEWLKNQPWPGNIRELRNVLERSVIIAENEVITCNDLMATPELEQTSVFRTNGTLSEILEEQERQTLIKALEKHSGNVVAASRDLGLPRRTFYDKMKRLGVDPAKFRSST